MRKFAIIILIILNSWSLQAETDDNFYIIQYPSIKKELAVGAQNIQVVSENKRPIKKAKFKKAVQEAIKELEGSISGTCARIMKVILKIDISGSWSIVEVGIGGSVEVEILNPNLPKNCAKF